MSLTLHGVHPATELLAGGLLIPPFNNILPVQKWDGVKCM